MESLKNGKCVLEKSLNFLVKKGPWKSEQSVRGGDSEKRFAACSIRTRLRFQFAANLFARPKKVASYADLTMLQAFRLWGFRKEMWAGKTARGLPLSDFAGYDKE